MPKPVGVVPPPGYLIDPLPPMPAPPMRDPVMESDLASYTAALLEDNMNARARVAALVEYVRLHLGR